MGARVPVVAQASWAGTGARPYSRVGTVHPLPVQAPLLRKPQAQHPLLPPLLEGVHVVHAQDPDEGPVADTVGPFFEPALALGST